MYCRYQRNINTLQMIPLVLNAPSLSHSISLVSPAPLETALCVTVNTGQDSHVDPSSASSQQEAAHQGHPAENRSEYSGPGTSDETELQLVSDITANGIPQHARTPQTRDNNAFLRVLFPVLAQGKKAGRAGFDLLFLYCPV